MRVSKTLFFKKCKAQNSKTVTVFLRLNQMASHLGATLQKVLTANDMNSVTRLNLFRLTMKVSHGIYNRKCIRDSHSYISVAQRQAVHKVDSIQTSLHSAYFAEICYCTSTIVQLRSQGRQQSSRESCSWGKINTPIV